MTFLNPAVLFGLVAVAIPVVLHLLNLRKLRTVEFSTLAFLKQLQKSKMRKLKLRQILLLIVRTLIVASLVLAFARPAIRGTTASGLGSHTKTSIVLLLDDSFSMSATDEYGSQLNQAKSAALNILSLLKEGDEVYFHKFSDRTTEEILKSPARDFSAVKSAVGEAKISMTYHTLGEILGRAGTLSRHSKNVNKEVYLITDLQRTNFALGDKRGIQPKTTLSELFDNQTRLYLVPVGQAAAGNVAVNAVKIMNKIFEKDRPFSLEATIRNYGGTPLRNYTVSLYLDGKRVMQKSVDIPADGVSTVPFSAVPKRTGYLSGYVECEPDPIDSDNERYFTINIPEKTDILFVTNSPRDISYLQLALAADERSRSSYGVEIIDPAKLLMTPLSRHDVMIICNVKSFSETEAERIKQFATEGGGILLFPGTDLDIPQYTNGFCRTLKIAPFTGRTGSLTDRSSFLSFGSIDFAHPIFSGMFEAKSMEKKARGPSIESPHIYTNLEYHPGATGQSIIRLSDGASFLTEYRIGNGKLLLYSVSPTLYWSDFPVRGIFVPLVRKSVSYLASSDDRLEEHLAGAGVTLNLPQKALGASQSSGIVHKSPDGEEEMIQPGAGEKSGERVFAIKKTDAPGVHEIVRGNQLISSFSVNVDVRESDVRRMTVDEAVKWLTLNGMRSDAIQVLHPNERPDVVILQSRFGVELWKYFLGLAIVCALTEMIVGRTKREKAERSGQ